MLCIALNDNNDIYVNASGNLATVTDLKAVETAVSCETKITYGEVPLNIEYGVPYFDTIFTAHPDIELWKSYMTDMILTVPNVTSISYFKTYIDKSVLKYAVVINTVYGQGELNG